MHCVIAEPATDVVGNSLLVSTTVDVDAVHDPLLIVQVNVALVPAVIPVTPELYADGLVILAIPLVTVHKPVPIVGLFPAKVNVGVLHCVIAEPATDVVGKGKIITFNVTSLAIHPVEVVVSKT